MRIFLSLLITVSIIRASSQSIDITGIWAEYKREIIADTSLINFKEERKDHFPDMLMSVYKTECIITHSGKTETLDYEIIDDSIHFTGFNKNIFSYSRKYYLSFRRELVIVEKKNKGAITEYHHFKKIKHYPSEKDTYYVSEMTKDIYPMFPGGPKAYQEFVRNNIQKVEDSYKDKMPKHELMLTFDENGKIIQADPIGDIGFEYLKECRRLIELMPAWQLKHAYIEKAGNSPAFTSYTCYPISIIFYKN